MSLHCPKCDKPARFYGNQTPGDERIGCSCDNCGLLVVDGNGQWVEYTKLKNLMSIEAEQDLKSMHGIDIKKQLKEIIEFEFRAAIEGKVRFGNGTEIYLKEES
jgi:hypothetical protein